MRTVTASGWPYEYRAHVYRYEGFFRKGWKFTIEERWVHWRHHKTSWRVFKTEDEAKAAANLWLDHKDGYATRKEFV